MIFLSTYINKIDKKGRVSVPSSFRSLLSEDFAGMIVYESIGNGCIEACSLERIKKLNDGIDQLDPYSDERDAFASVILGGSIKLPFDSEGRVLLPETLLKFAALDDKACFVGKGNTFEIWNPDKYEEHYARAKAIAQQHRNLLRFSKDSRG